jgi:glycerol-3-phosphate acyltransferase PlsX
VFLGLNGIVVKSHGSASAAGVANAVHVTARLLEENVTERITADLARVGEDSLKRHRAAKTGAPATGDAA